MDKLFTIGCVSAAAFLAIAAAKQPAACVPAPLQPLDKVGCLSIELPYRQMLEGPKPTAATTIIVDPARVASMVELPQFDTIVREVAAQ